MQEIWKDIPEYEGVYQVSNRGRIKSLRKVDNIGRNRKEKIIKQRSIIHYCKHRKYIQLQITLSNGKRKEYYVSRLVWTAFNGDIPDGYEIDHIDNNPENNRLDNLQLLTHSENCKKRCFDNPDLRLLKAKKVKCLNNGIIYESISEAARQLNLYNQHICCVLKGKQNHTHGYRFEYC